MGAYFDHEKLRVYQEALAFCGWWETICHRQTIVPAVRDQLDRASTSMPLNIAEGNAKLSMKDRSRCFQVAQGSAQECAACLDVLVIRRRLTQAEVEPGKQRLLGIVAMLVGLIGSVSDRVAEEPATYLLTPPFEEPTADV